MKNTEHSPQELNPVRNLHPACIQLNEEILFSNEKHLSNLTGKLLTFVESIGGSEEVIKARKDIISGILSDHRNEQWPKYSREVFDNSFPTIIRQFNEWLNREIDDSGTKWSDPYNPYNSLTLKSNNTQGKD